MTTRNECSIKTTRGRQIVFVRFCDGEIVGGSFSVRGGEIGSFEELDAVQATFQAAKLGVVTPTPGNLGGLPQLRLFA